MNIPNADTRKTILIAALIVVACSIVYGQVVGFDFINIDDRAYVWENPAVQSGLNFQSIVWAFKSFYSANWHPLTWLSHMLDAQLFGPWAGGHHLTNAILHTVNSILVFVVLRSMTGSVWKSGVVALLFAVHPAHVESVAWIAERKDVLSTMFWLLAMIAYIRCVRSKETEVSGSYVSAWLRMWPVTILFAVGLMAKPMLVTLPFALLLCDYWPLGRLKKSRDLRPLLIEKIPLFILTIVSSVITVIAQSSAGAAVSLTAVPFSMRLANVVISYGRYIRMLFYPVELGLWYPLGSAVDPLILFASGSLLAIITVFVWRYRRGNEYLLMGWLWFLGTLVPVVGLVQVGMQSHADRYTYVPYLGLFLIIVWGAAALSRRWAAGQKIVAAAAIVILLTLTALAYRQVSLWRNSETLYTHALSFTENNHFLMSNLCLYYVQKTDVATADQKCSELLGQMPPSADALQTLGYLKLETGKFSDAVRMLREASRLDPGSAQIQLQLAEALARQGNPIEAEAAMQRALTTNKVASESVARTSSALAAAFLKSGRKDKAIEYYQKVLSAKPDATEARENLEKLGVK
jgi:cytochrome c-type biogenesis protein CcmH/NrfG